MPYKCPVKRREASKLRQRKYREKNREKLNEKLKQRWHDIYKDKPETKTRVKKYNKEYREANPEKMREYKTTPEQIEKQRVRSLKYQKNNRGKVNANNNLRKKRVRRAMPPWADRKAISEVYQQSSEMQRLTGVKYHVDHIVPLINDNVCGLHVHWNLQIIPASVNLKKGNKLITA